MTSSPPAAPVLLLGGITERFGSLTANNDVSVEVVPGRIHCLLGKNKAGKSALVNILFGLLAPDGGEVWLGEEQLRLGDPRQAMAADIGMVHQHFILIPLFAVVENMVLGYESSSAGLLDVDRVRWRVREPSKRYRPEADPDILVEDLPVGIQQRVEILKSLALNAYHLIFDEPTAVLIPQEIGGLMGVIYALRDEGRAIVFITHKLREVLEVADDTIVIRRGRVVGRAESTSTKAELAVIMVGRSAEPKATKQAPRVGGERLAISGLAVASAPGVVAVDYLDLTMCDDEIIVIAGVQGNGQSELAGALLGTVTPVGGTITLDGADVTWFSPAKTPGVDLGYVPGDRDEDGLIRDSSIAQNLVLDNLDHFSVDGNLKLGQINQHAAKLVKEFDTRTDSYARPARSLSGGNQQKVVLARELSRSLLLLPANQPTRGVDVGAIELLYNQIITERDRGTAVLIISAELGKVESLADCIAIMYRGRIVGVVGSGTPHDVLGLMVARTDHDDAITIMEQEGQA